MSVVKNAIMGLFGERIGSVARVEAVTPYRTTLSHHRPQVGGLSEDGLEPRR
jgi:hypothetical protein